MNKCASAVAALIVAVAGSAAWLSPAHADIRTDDATPVTGIAWDGAAGTLFVVGPQDGALVGMVGKDGRPAGKVTFGGTPKSVQGLALAADVLYVADIGDESQARPFVTVFGLAAKDGRQSYKAWDFKYPDGAHDAKAFLVSGKGRFYFITSGDNPGIYRAELNPSRQDVNKLVRAADAPKGVTDAAFLTDGTTMLIRTGGGVSLIDATTWKTVATTTYADGPDGESITPFTSGRMLVGSPPLFREEQLPAGTTTVTPVPSQEGTAGASPTGTASESPTANSSQSAEAGPTATQSPAPDVEATVGGVSRSGTILALFGALGVALAAGTVVFLIRN